MMEAKITDGPIFRAINKAGRIAGHGFSPKVIWGVVKQACRACDLGNVAPHDLRRYAEDRIMPKGLASAPSLAWFSLDHTA